MTETRHEAQIVDLESRLAFQEDALAGLNEALVAQQQQIAQLEKLLSLVIDRIRTSELELDLPAVEPPPPHY